MFRQRGAGPSVPATDDGRAVRSRDLPLIDALERLEGRAVEDLFTPDCGNPAGDGRLPETRHAERTIHSSARLVAFDLLNAATPTVPERKVGASTGRRRCWLTVAARSRPVSAWRS
jgi:hypothetical protein